MKRFLPLLAIVALVFPALVPAGAADVSVNFFYENLEGGNWYQIADYGYVWQPEAAATESWRPYTDGYWAYSDQGWTWVSYEDFGWATYHYGRWARLADYGWCWVPGTEWGPAWVSWRAGGDSVGWAPLPPAGDRVETVYESRPIDNTVDVQFGIGPSYYNFVDLRFFGEPMLRPRIYGYDRNIFFLENTVNITNIVYNNAIVYNYGPDYALLSRYSTRPIPRLTIERENIAPLQALRAGEITKVQGNKLHLAAPERLVAAPANQFAPKIKGRISQPKLEKGWANVNDPALQNRLEQKFRNENPKNIPKPDFQPGENVAKVQTRVAGESSVNRHNVKKERAPRANVRGNGSSGSEGDLQKHERKAQRRVERQGFNNSGATTPNFSRNVGNREGMNRRERRFDRQQIRANNQVLRNLPPQDGGQGKKKRNRAPGQP